LHKQANCVLKTVHFLKVNNDFAGYRPSPTCYLPVSKVCDGVRDCSDNSDEKNCKCPANTPFQCDCYKTGCSSGRGCFVKAKVCDGLNDCGDWSDEKGCGNCPSHYPFKCACYQTGCPHGLGCIEKHLRCDGNNTCGDWSDEIGCLGTSLFCDGGECIERKKVNDKIADLKTGKDELACSGMRAEESYGPNTFQCVSSGRCIPSSWVGDAVIDCPDKSDEPCNAYRSWCGDCWVIIHNCSSNSDKDRLLHTSLSNITRCHRIIDPSHTNQLNTLSMWSCITSSCGSCLNPFRCKDGYVIDRANYCDAVVHCQDGSDEAVDTFGFRCSGRSRKEVCNLPQSNLFDSTAQCADMSDLCFSNNEFRCFLCLDKRHFISAKQVCDGMLDCSDASDECLCSNSSVCDEVLGGLPTQCPHGQMRCHNGTDCAAVDEILCNSSVACDNNSNQKFCYLAHGTNEAMRCGARGLTGEAILVTATKCDKRPECAAEMEDECATCNPKPSFCNGRCAHVVRSAWYGNRVCDGYVNDLPSIFRVTCSRQVEEDCPMRFPCTSKGMVSIDKRSVCDGIFDCDDHSDETDAACIANRFNCSSGKAFSINRTFVCDGVVDCDNGEDEEFHLCGNRRFYCEKKEPVSIDKAMVGNGFKDCFDGSDECKTLFSNRYEMIASPILRALFWIMGCLAVLGNLAVGISTVRELFNAGSDNIRQTNNVLIVNLSLSDFLMGVYLLGVVSFGRSFSGFYCFADKQWRSGKTCSGFGALAVLSSETSAFIMATMSSFRLFSIHKPAIARFIKVKWIIMLAMVCWILSALLATIPLLPFESGYFISAVWFPNLFFKTDTVSKQNLHVLAKRLLANNSKVNTLLMAEKIVSEKLPYSHIKGEFGYYGHTSVCMPLLFASRNQAAWEYSTFIVTVNFFLFIYMVIGYALVYKKVSSSRRSLSVKKDQNKNMQKRISRLLLTDFICWIPVCTMGYLSLAGVPLPKTVYVVSAGFLLPINSSTNPILYSRHIAEYSSRVISWLWRNTLGKICSIENETGYVSARSESGIHGHESNTVKTSV